MKAAVDSYQNVWTSVGFGSCAKGIHVKGSRNNTAQEKGDMGKKNYQLSPELMTYALSRSFSHTSYGTAMFLCPTSPLMCQSVVAVADVARPWLAHKERWVKGVGPVCMCGCKLRVYIVHEIVLSYFQDACCTNVETCAYVRMYTLWSHMQCLCLVCQGKCLLTKEVSGQTS